MNWKLILLLSLSGILIGLANVYVIPAKYSAVVEMPVYLGCAYVLARVQERKHFVHGVVVGVICAILATAVRIVLVEQYLTHQYVDAAQYRKLAAESHGTITQVLMLMGVLFTILSGLVTGLFALAAGKIINNMSGR